MSPENKDQKWLAKLERITSLVKNFYIKKQGMHDNFFVIPDNDNIPGNEIIQTRWIIYWYENKGL